MESVAFKLFFTSFLKSSSGFSLRIPNSLILLKFSENNGIKTIKNVDCLAGLKFGTRRHLEALLQSGRQELSFWSPRNSTYRLFRNCVDIDRKTVDQCSTRRHVFDAEWRQMENVTVVTKVESISMEKSFVQFTSFSLLYWFLVTQFDNCFTRQKICLKYMFDNDLAK